MRKSVFAAIAALIIFLPVTLYAAVLEEVVVTAQKREQRLQDVGIAVTAMSGDQMEALGFDTAQQVTAMAPGVSTVQPNGEANYSIAIRGVANSDFTTNVESPVAVYLDEVYVSQMSGTGFMLFDMERVEILRGPQGTLYGRNATGGLAHFLTIKPSQEADGYAKVTYGDYDQFKFEGAVGGGITDEVSGRISISHHKNDGYIENRLGGDLNNADDLAVRAQLLFEPSDTLSLLFNVRRFEQDIDTGFFENVSSMLPGVYTPATPNPVLGYIDNDGDVYAGDYDDPGFNNLETGGFTMTANKEFENFDLTMISDYSTVERQYIEDSDASPVSFFNFFLTTDATQWSQELRVDSSTDTIRWVAGIYYLNLDIEDSNGAITDPFIGPAPTAGAEAGLNNPYDSELRSLSVFGQIEYALADDLNFIVGARIIRDDRDFSFTVEAVEFLNPDLRNFDVDSNLNSLGVIAAYQGDRSDTEVSLRLQLDWALSDDTLIYGSWNRGVKGGGYNAPIFPLAVAYTDDVMSFDPEELDAFEFGFKHSFMDGRARLNGALYFYDYSDYQAFNIVGVDTLTFNADADSEGYELELQVSPGEGWDILVGVAYNDIEVDVGGGVHTTSVQSPEWNVNALVRYEWALDNGGVAIQADTNYRSEHTFSLAGMPVNSEDGYSISNVALTYRPVSEKWALSAFVENVADKEYIVQTFDLSTDALFGMTEQYYGRPRWWGVSVRYNW